MRSFVRVLWWIAKAIIAVFTTWLVFRGWFLPTFFGGALFLSIVVPIVFSRWGWLRLLLWPPTTARTDPGDKRYLEECLRRLGCLGFLFFVPTWLAYYVLSPVHKIIRPVHGLWERKGYRVPRKNPKAPFHPVSLDVYLLCTFAFSVVVSIWAARGHSAEVPLWSLFSGLSAFIASALANNAKALFMRSPVSPPRSVLLGVMSYFEQIVLFAALYAVISQRFANSFKAGVLCWWQAIVLSASSMTTLGYYGDLVPQSSWPLLACSFQSVIGVIFIAVFAAGFLSWFARRGERPGTGTNQRIGADPAVWRKPPIS